MDTPKGKEVETVPVNSVKAWLLATRPKTLTGAMIPVLLAGAMVWHDASAVTGSDAGTSLTGYTIAIWVCCLLFAGGMQITANLINDLLDFLKGTDREDRLGPERACAMGWITPEAMRRGIGVSIALSGLAGLGALALYLTGVASMVSPTAEMAGSGSAGWWIVVMGMSCVLFAYLYTKVFSYMGLGDLLVLVFFGLVPVCGTYFVMTGGLTTQSWLLGAVSGIAIDALLIVNNYRDREQDRVSGKRTLVVLLGEKFGRYSYLGVGLLAAALAAVLLAWMGNAGRIPVLVLYLALHIRTWVKMVEIFRGRALNQILGETSRNMLVLGVTLAWALL